jgi:hypothetical protein
MRWRTAAHISVAHFPRDSSTMWRFDARGTDRDLPSTTAPSSKDHPPSRSRALTSAFGRGRSRYVHASDRNHMTRVGSLLLLSVTRTAARAARRRRPRGSSWVTLDCPEPPRSRHRADRSRGARATCRRGRCRQTRLLALVVAAGRDDRDRPGLLVDTFEEPDAIVTRQREVGHNDVRFGQTAPGLRRPSRRP